MSPEAVMDSLSFRDKMQKTDTPVSPIFSKLNLLDQDIATEHFINFSFSTERKNPYDEDRSEQQRQNIEDAFMKLNDGISEYSKREMGELLYRKIMIENYHSGVTDSYFIKSKISALIALSVQSNNLESAVQSGVEAIGSLRGYGIGQWDIDKIGGNWYEIIFDNISEEERNKIFSPKDLKILEIPFLDFADSDINYRNSLAVN